MAANTNKKKIRYTKAPIKARAKKGNKILVSEAFVKKGSTNLRSKMHVSRGDTVIVISGDDKGKIGKVLEVYRSKGKVLVEGVNLIKKHQGAMGPGRPGEIIEKEAPIAVSKVMLWDEANKKASRVGKKVLESGEKVRIYKTSGEQID